MKQIEEYRHIPVNQHISIHTISGRYTYQQRFNKPDEYVKLLSRDFNKKISNVNKKDRTRRSRHEEFSAERWTPIHQSQLMTKGA